MNEGLPAVPSVSAQLAFQGTHLCLHLSISDTSGVPRAASLGHLLLLAMDRVTQGHPIGYAGAKGEYRRGVKVANFAEEVLAADFAGQPGCILDSAAGSFQGTTVSRETYTPHQVSKPARDDLVLKYVKYGRSSALPTDNVSAYATMNQLAYEPPSVAQQGSPHKVQDLLWAGTKFVDRKVPLSAPGAHSLVQERRRQWDEELRANPYSTVEREQLAAVAQSPDRATAKPPQCRPQAVGGQEAQVGRKAAGPCAQHFDKDWLRIGLRKGGSPPPA